MRDKVKEVEVILRLDNEKRIEVRRYCFWNKKCLNLIGDIAVRRDSEVAFPCPNHFEGYIKEGWRIL